MRQVFLPDFSDFETCYRTGTPQIVFRRLVNDLDTPVSAFLKIATDSHYAFLFESVTGGEQRGRYSILGLNPDIVWSCHENTASIMRGREAVLSGQKERLLESPLQSLRALIEDCAFELPDFIPPMASGLFGYLGYDMVRHIEALPEVNPDPLQTPDGIMIRPTIVAIFDQIAQEIILSAPVFPEPGASAKDAYETACARINAIITQLKAPTPHCIDDTASAIKLDPRSPITRAQFCERVAKAKSYIEAGDVFQVVIGHRFSENMPASAFALYRSLRRMNPSPFLYYLKCDDHAVVGSSPEILVRLRDDTVTIRPIAGTRPRGKSLKEDLVHEQDLINDPKERAEHLMLLDLGRNDVGRVSRAGTVTVTEQYQIERYSHVMHIVSNVEGEIKPELDALSALFAGFPAGTVSGAPKVRAMEIINELETEKRGIYGGAVGYISSAGDMDTAIALRTGIIKDNVLHVRAGAGIVADSDPNSEYEETVHKSAALFRAAEQSLQFASYAEDKS